MIPVEQTEIFRGSGNRGNCTAACIASIFEIPITDVVVPGGHTQLLREWTAARYPALGVESVSYLDPVTGEWLARDEPGFHPGYWIATVESPRFTEPDGEYLGRPGLHAVVMRFGRMVWDPHPRRGAEYTRWRGETWWSVVNPALL